MAVTNFQSEVWSAELLSNLQKATVYASPAVVNRNYEGDIRQQGDTVRITAIAAVNVGSYTGAAVTWQTLTDSQQSLLIDQSKYFAFVVDDVDEAQSAGNGALMAEATREAAYALRDTADQFIAGLYTGANASNQLGTVSVTSAALASAQLVSLGQKLDEANVTTENRYVVIPPWYHSLLLADANFLNAEKSGNTDAIRNGRVGRGYGFDIYVSNNCVNPAGDDWAVMAGVPGAITYAEQISKTVAVQLQDTFADGVKGLHVYGGKVIRDTAIATVVASIT